MSGEPLAPNSSSTPSRAWTRSRTESATSQSDNLSEGWSTDLEGIELLDDISLANCKSVASTNSDFNRELLRDFDKTIVTNSNVTSDSDSEYLAADSVVETSDVFLDISTSSQS